MTYNSSTVANFFVKKYSSRGVLTPMKLIKLTYLAYSWYLALTNGRERLIDESPEAWDYGPVFPSLYQSLKQYGKVEINDPIPYNKEEVITNKDAKFLTKIWKMYGKYNGVELSAMTHSKDTPWKKVYNNGCNSIIPDNEIISHYSAKLKPRETSNI